MGRGIVEKSKVSRTGTSRRAPDVLFLVPSLAPLVSNSSSYWQLSRAPRYSLLFVLPLLALYEGLAALLTTAGASQVRNGAEVLLASLFSLVAGPRAALALGAVVALTCIGLAGWDLRRARGGLRWRVFGLMLAESAVFAVVCGVVVAAITARLLHAVTPHLAVEAVMQAVRGAQDVPVPVPSGGAAALGGPTRLMLSLGAGLFEELVFRVMLVGALSFGLRRWSGLRPTVAGAIAVLAGALVFAAAHYVGAYGDPFTVQSFAFRAIAGLFFSALFVLRGFGIAAWTHALYDVMVLAIG